VSFVDLTLAALALPVLAGCLYLGFLALVAKRGGRRGEEARSTPWRFDVIVPAHNEELGIAETIRSLSGLDYPADARRIVVVADNCVDATAEVARVAGASVLVRTDPERRGKGYALELAFAKSREAGFAEAVVVVDADTAVSPRLLHAFAAQLSAGAQAIQGSYGVRNPEASWRTRLMTLALALFNDLRSLARERLGLSAGLKGNGMCFTLAALEKVPHQAYSVVEDLEYGIRLGMAGLRVHFAADAQVKGEMVSGERASRSQRRRWEGGRWMMAKSHALPLLREALTGHNLSLARRAMLFDLGVDLLIPPLSYLALAAGALSLGVGVRALHAGTMGGLGLPMMAAADVCLVFYVLKGWALSGVGPRGLLDLCWAPVFVVWKVLLLISGRSGAKQAWVRTTREGETGSHGS
jgi:cellulose synthase/poly-beta-1,6-N-acetylglucosamine synthase-like glycosyltransferase